MLIVRTAFTRKNYSMLPALLGLMLACAPQAKTRSVTAVAPAIADEAPSEVMGMVNGREITFSDLPEKMHEAIADMDNEAAQRRLHLLWTGFERAIDERLMQAAAKKRGIRVADLLKAEVDEKFSPVTDADVKQFYEDAAGRIGVPFERAAPHIRNQLEDARKTDLRGSFMAQLRSGADIRYSLPVPVFSKRDVDTGGAPHKGKADAKVTIVEFSDFECPYCAEAKKVLDTLSAAYGDKVNIVYRDFPLGQHERAEPAAKAAQCAYEQDQFWKYHDLLFDNARDLEDDDLRKYALDLKLDMDAFDSCLASDRPGKQVARHKAAGALYGVDGTPALFINGTKLIGLLPTPLMRIIIDAELKR